MIVCNICSGRFEESPDPIVLCKHHDSFVHMGCCLERCSWNKALCVHSLCIYVKQPKK